MPIIKSCNAEQLDLLLRFSKRTSTNVTVADVAQEDWIFLVAAVDKQRLNIDIGHEAVIGYHKYCGLCKSYYPLV